MVRLSKFLWRIGFVPGEFISPGTCASVKLEVPLLTSNPIRLEEARPRKRPGFLRTDEQRGLTRRGQKELLGSSTDSVPSSAASTASRSLSVSGWCLSAACLYGYWLYRMGWFGRCEPSRRHPAAVSRNRCGAAAWARPEP